MIEKITERATLIRADNPGLMTLEGTNTWVLREPGAQRVVVVDPGPPADDHLAAILDVAGGADRVGLILFTHRHFDHTESLPQLVARTGAPARATDPRYCAGAEPLADDERITVDGLAVDVHHTPGHTSDSTCFRLPAENSLLTGDTVLGRGTTVVAHPDGVLGPYLDSLAELRELVDEGLVERILPGHGPVVADPLPVVDFYLDHRQERLDQVRAAVAQGARTPHEVVQIVYADVDRSLWEAAELSVAAQLTYLDLPSPALGTTGLAREHGEQDGNQD